MGQLGPASFFVLPSQLHATRVRHCRVARIQLQRPLVILRRLLRANLFPRASSTLDSGLVIGTLGWHLIEYVLRIDPQTQQRDTRDGAARPAATSGVQRQDRAHVHRVEPDTSRMCARRHPGKFSNIVDKFRKGVRRSLKHKQTKEQLKRHAAAKMAQRACRPSHQSFPIRHQDVKFRELAAQQPHRVMWPCAVRRYLHFASQLLADYHIAWSPVDSRQVVRHYATRTSRRTSWKVRHP